MSECTEMTSIKLRSFTEKDWDKYSGAEKPSDDQEPVIGEIKMFEGRDAVVIVDRTGIEIDINDSEISFQKDSTFEDGKILVEGLSDPVKIIQLLELGFELI